MIIRCIKNEREIISLKTSLPQTIEYDITVGKTYFVYGILHSNNKIFYLICEDSFDGKWINYPMYLLKELFTIIDGTLLDEWEICENIEGEILIGFPEIIHNQYFIGNITESNEHEVNIFRNIVQSVSKDR
jgi:hypothetical protein